MNLDSALGYKMGKDDYTSSIVSGGGGGLKLKGAKNAGIDKKKKKKNRHKEKEESAEVVERQRHNAGEETPVVREGDELERDVEDEDLGSDEGTSNKKREKQVLGQSEQEEQEGEEVPERYKTEAERRHEEMRRKRLDDRLRREGLKTHKQRVEDLNKYLSTLSEHHDMPRIGPG
ncbi:MAG: hypothetical protein M1831_006879 [Alyxoria varia]|nr:MAG: hypothetical protein M1831_006879 [Alyxoria varia]